MGPCPRRCWPAAARTRRPRPEIARAAAALLDRAGHQRPGTASRRRQDQRAAARARAPAAEPAWPRPDTQPAEPGEQASGPGAGKTMTARPAKVIPLGIFDPRGGEEVVVTARRPGVPACSWHRRADHAGGLAAVRRSTRRPCSSCCPARCGQPWPAGRASRYDEARLGLPHRELVVVATSTLRHEVARRAGG